MTVRATEGAILAAAVQVGWPMLPALQDSLAASRRRGTGHQPGRHRFRGSAMLSGQSWSHFKCDQAELLQLSSMCCLICRKNNGPLQKSEPLGPCLRSLGSYTEAEFPPPAVSLRLLSPLASVATAKPVCRRRPPQSKWCSIICPFRPGSDSGSRRRSTKRAVNSGGTSLEHKEKPSDCTNEALGNDTKRPLG